MNQIRAVQDWLPGGARWSYLARSSRRVPQENFPLSQIINPLLAKLFRSRWSPTFSVRPPSSVGRVTVDLIRRSWVRFPPRRSKDFFFTSCGSLIPFTRANAQWVIHGFNQHLNLHFIVNSLFHHLCSQCYAAQHSYVPLQGEFSRGRRLHKHAIKNSANIQPS